MILLSAISLIMINHLMFDISVLATEWVDQDVAHICDAITCPKGHVCRVVRHCERPECHPEFACVPCVPDAADKECNAHGFMNAVLFGYPSRAWTLSPLDCDDGKSCPKGSTCARESSFHNKGVCCYDGPASGPVVNTDEKCMVCIPECEGGFMCQQMVDKCGEKYNSCAPTPKRGNCPNPKKRHFLHGRRKVYCKNDQDCPGLKKCCHTGLGGFDCVYPVLEI